MPKEHPTGYISLQDILNGEVEEKLEELSSYRPISIVSIVSKLFEKLTLTRFTSILEDNNLISDHEVGFREK